MWEFTAHKYSAAERWTWVRVSAGGRSVQRSQSAFDSYTRALEDAIRHGFNALSDKVRLIELA